MSMRENMEGRRGNLGLFAHQWKISADTDI